MKSDILLASERAPHRDDLVAELEETVNESLEEWIVPTDPGGISLPVIRRPSRQVTLLDLRQALQRAMNVSRRRAQRLIERVELEDDYDPFEPFELGGTDFGARLHALFERIRGMLSGRRVLSFFRLLDRGDKEERIQRFFEVLHLMAEGQITCTQNEFLGDILISLEPEA
jgi:chromatin segregation and condensation protein Rec8/ScpA/Scc1 (kleisin family)